MAALPVHAASPEAHRLNESAVALTAQGRYEEAAALFTQALRLSPDDEVIRRNLGRLRTVLGHRFLQAGLLEKAEEQYQTALDLVPDEPTALLGLGDVQLRRRQPRAAAETYRRAVGVDPQNPEAHIRLGEAYYNQGDLGAALSAWEWALSLRPQDGWLRQRVEGVQREARIQGGYRSRVGQHFTVIYEGERREDAARELIQILERAYADVGYELGAYPPHDIQTIFYSDADFTGATGLSSRAGGFYHLLDGKIRIALKGLTPGDSVPVLYHEYTHALIYAITQGKTPPRWMDEGLAVHMERKRAAEFKQEAIRQARAGIVPLLDASPYTHGSVAIEFLIERHGMASIQQLLRQLGDGLPFAQAFRETFRTDLATFQRSVQDLLMRGD
jgi:tetratricopeptide (TPR) repeat protein